LSLTLDFAVIKKILFIFFLRSTSPQGLYFSIQLRIPRRVDGKKYDKTLANDKDVKFCAKIKRSFHNYYCLLENSRRINNSFDKIYNIKVHRGEGRGDLPEFYYCKHFHRNK